MAGQDELIYRVVYESDEASLKAVQAQLNALTQQTAQQIQKAQLEALKSGAGVQGLKAIDDIAKSAKSGINGMVELSRKIAETKTELKKLSDEQKKNGSLTDEQAQRQVALKASLSATQTAYREAERDLVAISQASGQIAQTYNELVKENKALSAELRNIPLDDTSGRLKTLQEQYKANNDKLKAFDATLGNHQRNVGNYTESIKAAAGELNIFGQPVGLVQKQIEAQYKAAKDAQGGIAGLKGGFMAFNSVLKANLVFAVASALVSLANALSTVQPVMDAVSKLTSQISGAFSGLVRSITLGGGLFASIKQGAENAAMLNASLKQTYNLETDLISNRAKLQAQIAENREAAKDETKTVASRIRALTQAFQLQNEIAKQETKVAQRRLEEARLEQANATDLREGARKVAEAEAALEEVRIRSANAKKELTENITSLNNKEKQSKQELLDLEIQSFNLIGKTRDSRREFQVEQTSFDNQRLVAEQNYNSEVLRIQENLTAKKREIDIKYANDTAMANAAKAAADAQAQSDAEAAYQAHVDRLLGIDQNRMLARIQMAEMTANAISSISEGLAAVGLLSAKKAFAIGKAADLAQATTAGYLATTRALAVPPAPNFLLAGLAAAAATGNILKIAGTKFNEGGGGISATGGSGGGSSFRGGSVGATPGISLQNVPAQVAAMATPQSSTSTTFVVQNNIDRAGIATMVKEGNDELSARGLAVTSV